MSNGTAALLSLVIPGLGQLGQERIGMGAALMIAAACGYAACIVPGIVVHIWAVVDAARYKPLPNSTPQ